MSPSSSPVPSNEPFLTAKRRDRPPALDIVDSKSPSNSDIPFDDNASGNVVSLKQPRVHVSGASDEQELMDSEIDAIEPISRSVSATSSLDPYYFGAQSPSDSPGLRTAFLSTTPETRTVNEPPMTPAKDPANIDRRGLVGVGELATPRWAKSYQRYAQNDDEELQERKQNIISEEEEQGEELIAPVMEKDDPDSPWTIEAVDGESDEKDEPTDVKSIPHTIRTRRSMAEESGGEEILYPRKLQSGVDLLRPHDHTAESLLEDSPLLLVADDLPSSEQSATSPPSSFVPPLRKAKKRTSDEFEMDQTGSLVSKRLGSSSGMKDKSSSKEEKTSSARKHRSLGVNVTSTSSTRERVKERRRESLSLSSTATKSSPVPGATASVSKPEKHTRQVSASESSSSHNEAHHQRRVHTTDFSHLPPSPSSSSIQHFLRHAGSANSGSTPPLRSSSKEPQAQTQAQPQAHSSPSVAHSLLRGTQEGWSGMDDDATAEALRKLDGLSGKIARARASVGSLGRPASLSRPGTPASRTGVHWEGVGTEGGKVSRRGSAKDKDKDREARQSVGLGLIYPEASQDVTELGASAVVSSDDQAFSSGPDKTPKKSGSSSTRLSFTPKRGSASSTNYTSTPTSSRDSASLSTATSATSVSMPSGRHSSGKIRRNSAGSDISNPYPGDSTSGGDIQEDYRVPPVPPLPKDLSGYRSPPQSSGAVVFPPANSDEGDLDRTICLEVPPIPSKSLHPHTQNLQRTSNNGSLSAPESTPAVPKTPSKKWSFSNALNIKLSSSPSLASMKDSPSKSSAFPLSPRSVTFGQQLRKSGSRENPLSPSTTGSKTPWSPIQQEAMASAASLASMSSIGSTRTPKSPGVPSSTAKTPDRGVSSRPGTGSSASHNTTSALSAPHHAPLSPSSSVRRHQSKRLTPSSIPFFRRSSSQSMQLPPSASAAAMSTSPTLSTGPIVSGQTRVKASISPSRDRTTVLPPTPASSQKKSSVLSLGLPSLLKGSSSRRSLHGDKSDSNKESKESTVRAKNLEKEKAKQDQKDRSESRISVLMGRKRGKTLSSTDPKKGVPAVSLPPMQMSAIPPATAQRVASLKTPSSSSSVSTPSLGVTRTVSSSRLTSQTVSSMQKQSDASLRSRNHLPTIAGSPSVGTNSYHASKEPKEHPPSALLNSLSSAPKETPTKIPRISSRTSATGSPTLKNSTAVNRRISLNVTAPSTDPSPTPAEASTNEFGVFDNGDVQNPKQTSNTTSQRQPVRASPSTSSRVPRQVSGPPTTSGVPRKSNRDSVSFSALRKASTGSVASISSAAPPAESHHRFSALSPSKGLKLLSPKISLPTSRSSSHNNSSSTPSMHQAVSGTPSSSGRQSLSTPSPAPSSIDEEEMLGDEEMMNYIRRQQTKKMANGATQAELDELLKFPEPIPPASWSAPEEVLKSPQAQFLSQYEREEILNHPQVYCIGARSQKKQATTDNTTNNHGYDDERGDYLVINHDHLAYRYEVIDTLGKGSFGQVLNCRDHHTGQSVAIKIIRNKKRFHHQALVEIKILDNLRKWDSEEKHHVIKMTEHFYFRNHLCIAMELLSINLYELIKANGFVGFTTTLIRRFTSQMLLSLCLMRHHRIVHCDLKPENVLLRHPAKSAIKVIDFGSSCFEHEKIYTYIQSRFYRSPEVILGMNYHMAIDMWSLGCILAELYTGFPIFPGENEQEQLSCIMEVLGAPDKEFVNRSSRKRIFFDNSGAPRPVVNSKGRRRRPGTKSLAQVLRCSDDDFVDFIARCLVWDPERRMKPQTAMQHAFVRAGRRGKITNPTPSTAKTLLSSSSLSGNRNKHLTETPKKSQISAPTPLTARSSRTVTNTVPSTPVHATSIGSSSRSYRSSQSHGLSSQYSSRTLGGFAVSRSSSPSGVPFGQELMNWLQTTAAK